MAIAAPTLTVTIDNLDPDVKPLSFQEESFPVDGSAEDKVQIKVADGLVPLGIAHIDTVKKIVIAPRNDKLVSMKLTIDDTINPVYTIIIPINKIFVWDLDPGFGSWITAIELSTTESSDVTVDFRVYGVTP